MVNYGQSPLPQVKWAEAYPTHEPQVWVGIDPGATGAMALISEGGDILVVNWQGVRRVMSSRPTFALLNMTQEALVWGYSQRSRVPDRCARPDAL